MSNFALNRDPAILARRCLGATTAAVTMVMEVLVGANTTATPPVQDPPAAPASALPTWA